MQFARKRRDDFRGEADADSGVRVVSYRGMLVIYFGCKPIDGSGVAIQINKKHKSFEVYGWYDGGVGISGGRMSLNDFVDLFKRRR